jgi:hypothetical protein
MTRYFIVSQWVLACIQWGRVSSKNLVNLQLTCMGKLDGISSTYGADYATLHSLGTGSDFFDIPDAK